MSSLRKIDSARANGARSRGPVTAEGKALSAQNAMRHGLLAKSIVLDNEGREGFDALFALHLDRLQPADGVEFGFIEEMAAAHWRLRRVWALETRLLENRVKAQPPGDEVDRMAAAFTELASSPALGLMHRYETRLHCHYQRSLHNALLLRAATPPANAPGAANLLLAAPGIPNEPDPISEHRIEISAADERDEE